MMQRAPEPQPQTESGDNRRALVILLGASNLTRGLPIVFETARCMLGQPIDVVAAIGHGRSYGRDSRVIVRSLPGILDCGLWRALDHQRPPGRAVALITDIGNDIVYGVAPDMLLQWIDTALDRLAAMRAEVVLTSLPMASITAAPRWQAHLAKLVTYPRGGPGVDEAIALAAEVDDGVRELARQRRLPLIELTPQWYGFDPIHIRRSCWPQAARTMLAPLHNGDEIASVAPSLLRWLRLRTARPSVMRLAGITLHRRQPVRTFTDSTTISLY